MAGWLGWAGVLPEYLNTQSITASCIVVVSIASQIDSIQYTQADKTTSGFCIYYDTSGKVYFYFLVNTHPFRLSTILTRSIMKKKLIFFSYLGYFQFLEHINLLHFSGTSTVLHSAFIVIQLMQFIYT